MALRRPSSLRERLHDDVFQCESVLFFGLVALFCLVGLRFNVLSYQAYSSKGPFASVPAVADEHESKLAWLRLRVSGDLGGRARLF